MKQDNAIAQFAADAIASPLFYISVGAAVAVKVVSSSEQVLSKIGDRPLARLGSPGSVFSRVY